MGSSRILRKLVEQAERLALVKPRPPMGIPELSRKLSVSEKRLRKAFNEIRGCPPLRQLKCLRFAAARRALLEAGDGLSVQQVASQFGFAADLGRFSVEYRSLFGEQPSKTLRRALITNGSKATRT